MEEARLVEYGNTVAVDSITLTYGTTVAVDLMTSTDGTTGDVDCATLTVTYVVKVLLRVVWDVGPEAGTEIPPTELMDDGAYETLPKNPLDTGVGVALPSAAVTGQMVVYRLMTSVVTWPILAGQSVTVGAQEVTV